MVLKEVEMMTYDLMKRLSVKQRVKDEGEVKRKRNTFERVKREWHQRMKDEVKSEGKGEGKECRYKGE